MRVWLILFFIGLCLSAGAQIISNTRHSTIYSVKQETSTTVIYDGHGQVVGYFFKNSLLDKNKNALAFIKDNGDVYKNSLLVGFIKKDRVLDANGQSIGHVYPDFGHATDDHGKLVMYVEPEVNSNLAAMLIFFIKDLK